MAALELRGQVFGRLLAISRDGHDKHGQPFWICGCECGRTTRVCASQLKRGVVQSCDCARHIRKQTDAASVIA
jgi:hypothetical protein